MIQTNKERGQELADTAPHDLISEKCDFTDFKAESEDDPLPVIPFLHDHAYVDIINSRNGSVIKKWLRSCSQKPLDTVKKNRALLIQHISNVAARNPLDSISIVDDGDALCPHVIKEIVNCLLDPKIQNELIIRGASTSGSAEKKKNRLIGLLIQQYGGPKSPVTKKDQKKTKKSQ